eukprot:1152673-Pelagomonas_calceolata.AAC.2
MRAGNAAAAAADRWGDGAAGLAAAAAAVGGGGFQSSCLSCCSRQTALRCRKGMPGLGGSTASGPCKKDQTVSAEPFKL